MSKEFTEKVMQLPKAKRRVETEGVGMGYSIICYMLGQLGGSISISSEIGVGSTVKALVPVSLKCEAEVDLNVVIEDTPSNIHMPRSYIDLKQHPRPTIQILLVDDEPFNQYAFKLIMENTLSEFVVSI